MRHRTTLEFDTAEPIPPLQLGRLVAQACRQGPLQVGDSVRHNNAIFEVVEEGDDRDPDGPSHRVIVEVPR